MAGKASLWSQFQIRNLGRALVALGAERKRMSSGQRKRKNIVGEIVPVCVHPIVAIQTCATKRHMVVGHKSYVHLIMAIITGLWVERSDILSMTITTQERFILSLYLVTV